MVKGSTEAECSDIWAKASYTEVQRVGMPSELVALSLTQRHRGEFVISNYQMLDLPEPVQRIDSPFVEGISAYCDETGSISFAFFFASKRDIEALPYRSEGEKVKVYFQTNDGDAPLVYVGE